MNILGAIILAALFLLAAFTLANGSALTEPTTLSLLEFNIDGPLGVILLGGNAGAGGAVRLLCPDAAHPDRRAHGRPEPSMKLAINEAANSLAALVGETDDKIDRALARGDNQAAARSKFLR